MRGVFAVLLIVIGCVLAPLAVVAVWTTEEVTNTDRYVQNVAPLARDPAVQNAVVDAVAHLGVRHIDMPVTSRRVWQALQAAQPGSEQ